ncbi:hypothetical protein GC173_01560 [bacterium]|nr:hypothetical protein [bacterium]
MAPLRKVIGALLTLSLAFSTTARGEGEWQSAGKLTVPSQYYTFLASTPSGDLVAATHNSTPANTPPAELSAYLIRNPTSGQPEVYPLTSAVFEAQRGFGGIATDPSGSFFVSGDTGNRATSFIRKFTPNGQPDASFGNGGEVRPNRRCMGLDALGNFLFVAVDWGEALVLDTRSGRIWGAVPQGAKGSYMRDVTIDPKSLRLFGVAQGGVLMWGGGAPWNLPAYRFAQFAAPVGEPRAGEGISIDPILRCLLVTPIPGNTLLEVFGNRSIRRTTIESAAPDAHLCDTSLSADGTTLFISDMRARTIHALKRPFPQNTAPPPPSVAGAGAGVPLAVAANAAPPVDWKKNYTDALQAARQAGKPMLVYFRRPGVRACDEFEKSVLLTNEFNSRAQPYVCVFEDAAASQLLARRLGVFRVPHVFILDKAGDTKAEFSFNIDKTQFMNAIDAYTK